MDWQAARGGPQPVLAPTVGRVVPWALVNRQRTSHAHELRLVLRRCDGAVLLTAQPETGGWQFPGGPVEPLLLPIDAASRLCRESLGLVPTEWIEEGSFRCDTAAGRRVILVCVAKIAADTALPLAGGNLAWWYVEQLVGVPLEPASREIAHRLPASDAPECPR